MKPLEKLKTAFDQSGLSVAEVADMAGLTKPSVYNLLNGRNPTLSTFCKVCEVLKLEVWTVEIKSPLR